MTNEQRVRLCVLGSALRRIGEQLAEDDHWIGEVVVWLSNMLLREAALARVEDSDPS